MVPQLVARARIVALEQYRNDRRSRTHQRQRIELRALSDTLPRFRRDVPGANTTFPCSYAIARPGLSSSARRSSRSPRAEIVWREHQKRLAGREMRLRQALVERERLLSSDLGFAPSLQRG